MKIIFFSCMTVASKVTQETQSQAMSRLVFKKWATVLSLKCHFFKVPSFSGVYFFIKKITYLELHNHFTSF